MSNQENSTQNYQETYPNIKKADSESEYQEKSTSFKRPQRIRNQSSTEFLQNREVLNSFTEVFDPAVYHRPQQQKDSDNFQVADGLVVHQNDTAVNHKNYGNMIIHDKSRIKFYPTSAQMMVQRNDCSDWDRKFAIGRESIKVFANRSLGGKKVLKPLLLEPEFDVPDYFSLSKFDEDLCFSSDVSARDNIKFNCSRFDNGGWIIDENRKNDLSSLIELEHSLDDKLQIDDPKTFFRNLRIIRANQGRNGSESSNASVNILPESSSSIQEEVFAQGNDFETTISYPFVSNYDNQFDLMNNKDIQDEIKRFKEETKNKEEAYKREIESLKSEVERSNFVKIKVQKHFKSLSTRVKKICEFVNNKSGDHEQSSTVEIKFPENAADTVDFSKPIPVQIKRVKIERIIDLVDDAMFLIGGDTSDEDEYEIIETKVVTKVETKVETIGEDGTTSTTVDVKINEKVEFSAVPEQNNENQQAYQFTGVPQGSRISPAHFQQILAARDQSENEWDSDEEFGVRISASESEEEEDEIDGAESLKFLSKRRRG